MAESCVSNGEALWYVVGVARPAPGGLEGVPALLPDQPLETVASRDLHAVVSKVPADLLEERAAADVDRVGQLARAHDRVLRALAERTVIVPARLGSLYPSRQAVTTMLDRRQGPLNAALDEVAGRLEWGVKAYGGPELHPASGDEAPTGTAYLRRRRAENRRRTADQEATAALAIELHRRVTAEAHAAVTRAPQHPKLSGVRAPMLLNASYLVDVGRQDSFTAVVRELAERHRPSGLRIQLTGPWPPYSFAGLGSDRS